MFFNRREFNAQLARKGLSVQKLAEDIGMPVSTMYRKLNNNGDFDREEIAKMVERLELDDPGMIFFAPKLT